MRGDIETLSKEITTDIGGNLCDTFTGRVWVLVEGIIVSEETAAALAAQAAESVLAANA